MPSTSQIILPQYNSGGNWDEKLITPESGKVLGFDASLNPIMVSGAITTFEVLTVRTSGGDYTSIQEAIDAVIINGYLNHVTIEVDDGTWILSDMLRVHANSKGLITIKGRNSYQKTLNSIQSVSGSAGNWTYILNMNDVTNISINDYIIIIQPSGGSNPNFVAGCHLITNVDSVNKRITVNSKNKSGTTPSGSVTSSNCFINKTVIKRNYNDWIVSIDSSRLYCENIIFDGNNTNATMYTIEPYAFSQIIKCGFVNSSGNAFNLYSSSTGRVNQCGISGISATGVNTSLNSTVQLITSAIVGNTIGVYAGLGSFAYNPSWASSIVEGNSTNYSPALGVTGNQNSYIGT